jgi:hypothetical protein
MRWLKALLPITVLALSLVLMVWALSSGGARSVTHTGHAHASCVAGCLGDRGCEREVRAQYRP